MLSSGKSGVVNEASNLKANQNLTSAIEYMASKEYQQSRDLGDVIPTHRPAATQEVLNNKSTLPVYDLKAEKKEERIERGNDLEDDDEDMELQQLRRTRMQQMMHLRDQEAVWRSKQHGQYREIDQDAFFNVVVREKGGSDQCCIHFYHKDFETCKVMDRRLSELAQATLSIRFVKIDAERAPFLVDRLRITTLPCLLMFKNDLCVDRILGFSGCTSEDGTLDVDLLHERINQAMSITNTAGDNM
ncbi:unnamed protein product [Phytomonas sp. EM1]|nr:unnamed protein product [Phytomonas sp. EM1]|eukprot:CCW63624.1 unnamed protein product [Phytomonas sp. isolate EM1]